MINPLNHPPALNLGSGDTLREQLNHFGGYNDFHILTTGPGKAPPPGTLANLAAVSEPPGGYADIRMRSKNYADRVGIEFKKHTPSDVQLKTYDATGTVLQAAEHWTCRTESAGQAFQAYLLARAIDKSARIGNPHAVTVTAYGKNSGTAQVFARLPEQEARLTKALPDSSSRSHYRQALEEVPSSGAYPNVYFGRPLLVTPSQAEFARQTEEAARARDDEPSYEQQSWESSHGWP